MIDRTISKNIKKDFFKGKIIIVTGARQVGKTTLVSDLLKDKDSVLELNGDNITDRQILEGKDFKQLESIVGDHRYIFIDEAQKIEGIGEILKLLVDNYKDNKQIIATGSSSLNLLSNTSEPLTGRKLVHYLYSLSLKEVSPKLNPLEVEKLLPNLLIYGSYPEVFTSGVDDKKRLLNEITSSYLYKDILELENIKNPAVLAKLLSALALQLGSEVSLNELSNLVGLDVKTVERYIDLLEKNYVIFRLPPYYTNKRKSLSKLNKIYFYDLGIRNSLINNFNGLDNRNDIGGLWENFLILERLKFREYNNIQASQFFWRTYDGAEIDLVEDRGGLLWGYEFKWGNKHTSLKSWQEQKNTKYKLINKENFISFVSKL